MMRNEQEEHSYAKSEGSVSLVEDIAMPTSEEKKLNNIHSK